MTATIASTSVWVTSLKAAHRFDRDVPFEVERGLGKQVAEARHGRRACRANTAATAAGSWARPARSSSARSGSGPLAAMSSAVRRRKISSRVSK